jgi:hypothetical protein
MKRLVEADVRLQLIQMRTGNALSLLLIRRARLVPRYSQMKRGCRATRLTTASEMLIAGMQARTLIVTPCDDDAGAVWWRRDEACLSARNSTCHAGYTL